MEGSIDVLEENLNSVLKEENDETFYFFGMFLSLSLCIRRNMHSSRTALPE
jgi:hypothetical protein